MESSAWSLEELQTRLLEEAYRPFDLERGPLLRVTLFTRSAREHILLLVVHHIVIDFWSLAILLDELSALYPAESAGVKAPLPPLNLQYTDYVRWQAEMLASPEGERLWAYWREQLAGQLPVLQLRTDRPRPRIPTYRGASHDFTMDAELSSGLKALAKAHGATLYMVLLAAFQVLLSYHTGQEDLLVGSPMVGRSRARIRKHRRPLHQPRRLKSESLPETRPSENFLNRFAAPYYLRWSIRITPPFYWLSACGRHAISATRRCVR